MQALQSVVREVVRSPKLKSQVDIFVIDNNSSDGSVSAIRAFDSQNVPVTIIANRDNRGFAAANNQGIIRSTGEYVLLLNSDTIVQPRALDRLVTAFEMHPVDDMTSELASQRGRLDRLGILAAHLRNPDETPQAQGGSFPTLWSLTSHMLLLDDVPILGKYFPSTQHTGMRAVHVDTTSELIQQDWVGGTAMVIRRSLFEEVGLLDDQIFMYGEDVEFCMRAMHHHWDVAIHPAAEIVHIGSASSTSARAIEGELKGYLYIWGKHKPIWQFSFARMVIKMGCALRAVLFGTMKSTRAKATIYHRLLLEL